MATKTYLLFTDKKLNNESFKYDFSNLEMGERIIEVATRENNNFIIVKITRDTVKECEEELSGQLSDGIWENEHITDFIEVM